MTNIRRYTYSNPTITASIPNTENDTLWLAYAQNGSGLCTLKKVMGTSPDQIYFSLTRPVIAINDMKLNSPYLYVAYQDSTVFAEQISITNPLTSFISVAFPSGVIESPVAVTVNFGDIWFLTPGLSGNYSKLVRYDSSMVWQQTVTLDDVGFEITDAVDVCFDSNGDLEVITNTTPSKFIRVYDTGGSIYAYQITETL